MALASAYRKVQRDDAEKAMIQCAFQQGHGDAADHFGTIAELRKDFGTALRYFQMGAEYGNKSSAFALRIFFDSEQWTLRDKKDQNSLKQLGVGPDPIRKQRYNEISDALELNPDLRLTRLDQVLPLPPAELPTWHGVQDAIAPEPDGPPTY